MTKLSVNINKLATLRNARGGNNPDLILWAQKIEAFGAQGITVHPRPDERHIRRHDVLELKPVVKTEFNIEGYPSLDFLELIEEVQPEQCTLVPDPPHVLTSNAGWNLDNPKHLEVLTEMLPRLSQTSRVSVFVEPETMSHKHASKIKDLGASRVELYTEAFAKEPEDNEVCAKYRICADQALEADLELNAGHDLDLINLPLLTKLIPEIKEVSIGHALICDALEYGMEQTIQKYLAALTL
jgi:pyridoxine 5-phosphate synthase